MSIRVRTPPAATDVERTGTAQRKRRAAGAVALAIGANGIGTARGAAAQHSPRTGATTITADRTETTDGALNRTAKRENIATPVPESRAEANGAQERE